MIKWDDVTVGASPLTNSIFIGKSKPMKGNPEVSEWTDKSKDKTQEVLRAVLDWFYARYKYDDKDSVELITDGKKYKLTFSIEVVEGGDK